MGVNFLRKVADQFKVTGDKAREKLAEPGLWSSRPEVLATDLTFRPSAYGRNVKVGDPLTIECVEGDVRAISGYREVGTMEKKQGTIAECVRERGNAISATVHEVSAFAFTARIREESR